jgi:hypothetical protein
MQGFSPLKFLSSAFSSFSIHPVFAESSAEGFGRRRKLRLGQQFINSSSVLIPWQQASRTRDGVDGDFRGTGIINITTAEYPDL